MTTSRKRDLRARRSRLRDRLPRSRGLTITKLIPNAITVSATCAGLTGIRFAIEGRFEFAAIAILVAAILDGLDGRMARLLKATSDFGKELDSLSDFVAFGVSPAMILYFWALRDLGGIGWAVALFLAVCCGLRLARFNIAVEKLPPYAYNYFQGVPAPAGAGLALMPLLASFEFWGGISEWNEMVAIWTVGVGLLMVSRLPTWSFKGVKIPREFALPLMAGAALVIAGLAGRPWLTLFALFAAYIATFPFSWKTYRRLRLEAERLQDGEEEVAPAPAAPTTAPDGAAAGPVPQDDGKPDDQTEPDGRIATLRPGNRRN